MDTHHLLTVLGKNFSSVEREVEKSILKDMAEVPPAHDYPLSFDEDNIAENGVRREQDRFPTEHGI